MSYLFRWARQQQSLSSRATCLLNGSKNATFVQSSSQIKPLYQVLQTRTITSARPMLSSASSKDGSQKNNYRDSGRPEGKEKNDDDGIEYVISYKKGLKVKDVIKQVYSLYGPVFVVCHILVSLSSLGFFCSLVMLSIDLNSLIPGWLLVLAGEHMVRITEQGGKFVVAYALHKILLPLRLVASIGLTRFVSRKIKSWRSKNK